jgi:hypothetical protein
VSFFAGSTKAARPPSAVSRKAGLFGRSPNLRGASLSHVRGGKDIRRSPDQIREVTIAENVSLAASSKAAASTWMRSPGGTDGWARDAERTDHVGRPRVPNRRPIAPMAGAKVSKRAFSQFQSAMLIGSPPSKNRRKAAITRCVLAASA